MKFCRSADMQAGTPPDAVYAREGASAKEVSAILRNDSIKERDPSELDEVLSYFHELAFQADPRSPLPVALEGDDRALALRDVLAHMSADRQNFMRTPENNITKTSTSSLVSP